MEKAKNKKFPEGFWKKKDVQIREGKIYIIPSEYACEAATFEAIATQKGYNVSVLTRPCGAIEILLY